MAAATSFVSTVKDAVARLQNADGTNYATLLAGSGSGQRLKSLTFTSDDTSARVIQIAKTVGGVDYPLGEISVPAGAGTDGATASVNGLDAAKMPALQFDGASRFLDLANGTTLKIRAKSAITAAKFVNAIAEYGDF